MLKSLVNRGTPVRWLLVFALILPMLLSQSGIGCAAVWDPYAGISSMINPLSAYPSSSGWPYASTAEIQFLMAPINDWDRSTTAGKGTFIKDTFLNLDAFTFSVKDAAGADSGLFTLGDNTANAASPFVKWTGYGLAGNYTVKVVAKDDAAIPDGDTGNRDDPDKSWTVPIRVGTATITDLCGNVAGGSISGTNISVKLKIDNMYYNTDNRIGIALKGLFCNIDNLRVDPVSSGGQPFVYTNASGDWPSTGYGVVHFDSTERLVEETAGGLQVRVNPAVGWEYLSEPIGYVVTLYNQAYTACNINELICGEQAVYNVNHYCTDMIHEESSTGNQEKAAMMTELLPATVFYGYLYGSWNLSAYPNETVFWDCHSKPGSDPSHAVRPSDVATALSNKSGTQPGYNIAHVDTSYSAGDGVNIHNDMAIAFGVVNADGSDKEDRVYLGFNGTCDDDTDHLEWTTAVWKRLSLGDNIEQAVAYATTNHDPGGVAEIIGDHKMKLHGLYQP